MIISKVTQLIANPPNLWGEGAIFAFSGLDGQTNTESQFVATFAAEPCSLLIHTPRRRVLTITLPESGPVIVATGDVLVVDTPAGELALTFSDWHTIVGTIPSGTQLSVAFEDEAATGPVSVDTANNDVLSLYREGQRLALAYGTSATEASIRAKVGLTVDLTETIQDRLALLANLPQLDWPERDRLLKKCVSVMKVNTLTPEGANRVRWSTPDRVPHRHLWLWDSVFHSLGMNHLDPSLAWEFLQAVLDRQLPNGMIPHMMRVNGQTSDMTQPPILAWGVWQNYQHTGHKDNLAYALPRLERYLQWNLDHRDANNNGLLEWFIEGDPHCRSGESGMDNSPRFDAAIALDAVDFSTFQALDMAYTAQIARELGDEDKAIVWSDRAATTSQAIQRYLWDDTSGFYLDRDLSGNFTGIKAVSGFLTLLLDDIPGNHVTRLIEHLHNPDTFYSPFSVPSVSLDDPTWSTDMWRGATWINYNYLIALGLEKQGQPAEAERLIEATIRIVDKYYRQFGVTFEFYDSADLLKPTECERKGPVPRQYDLRQKMSSIRDYHWTAALVVDLLLKNIQREEDGQ